VPLQAAIDNAIQQEFFTAALYMLEEESCSRTVELCPEELH
jgi:hypothetical protein